MKTQRVLIVEEDSLFSNGIRMLLARQKNLEITGMARTDIPGLCQAVQLLHPDVVILNEELVAVDAGLVVSLLKSFPEVRLMVLTLGENRVNVYNNQVVVVTSASDLAETISG